VKTKVAPRRPAPVEHDEPELHELWRGRPWAPVLIVAVLIAAVLGTGLAVDRALAPQIPAPLAGCKTSVQIAPHQFIGRQPICINAKNTYTATVNAADWQISANDNGLVTSRKRDDLEAFCAKIVEEFAEGVHNR